MVKTSSIRIGSIYRESPVSLIISQPCKPILAKSYDEGRNTKFKKRMRANQWPFSTSGSSRYLALGDVLDQVRAKPRLLLDLACQIIHVQAG